MINNRRLRHIALSCQGLGKLRPFGQGRDATLRALEHLGYVQIDTLAVVQRAHHHTLWTRVPDFRPDYIDQLIKDRLVFEYWSHAASYLPMNDYRFALPRMADARRGKSVYAKAEPKYMRHVQARIRSDGPLKARDFETFTKRKGSWWNWKPAKRALEQLFMQGQLMISARDGMQKVYDLTERVLPSHVDTREPTLAEFSDYLVRTSLRANGFTTLKQLTHVRPGKPLRDALATVLHQRVDAGTVVELAVEGWPTVFADAEVLGTRVTRPATRVRLLSPFDNAIIHRDRIQTLFDFDYRLECYVPQGKRQYGYFCLPVLFGDEFVGRVDCKAHRQARRFEIIHLQLDLSAVDADQFARQFADSMHRFVLFNDCDSLTVSNVTPRKLSGVIKKALRQVT